MTEEVKSIIDELAKENRWLAEIKDKITTAEITKANILCLTIKGEEGIVAIELGNGNNNAYRAQKIKGINETGYQKIIGIISDIDEFYNNAELREILQQILFICDANINEEAKQFRLIRNICFENEYGGMNDKAEKIKRIEEIAAKNIELRTPNKAE